MISAAKLRKAQERALASRPYARMLDQVLSNVAEAAAQSADAEGHPLLAVRPEKLRLTAEQPPPGQDNRVAATVADIGYLGDLSIYRLRCDDGTQIKAAVANTGRSGEEAIGWDDRVWLSFPPQAAIVLTR